MKLGLTAIGFVLCSLPSLASAAGNVEITDVHLCCARCVTGVEKALKDVDGVADLKCDRDAQTITFTAPGDDAVSLAIESLAKAGFFGKAKFGNEAVAFPASGAKEGAKANAVTLTNVHLCCGKCVSDASDAVKAVAGVSDVKCDREASSVTIGGKDVSVEAVVKALNDAGFHARVKE